jgi:hypothetical protein
LVYFVDYNHDDDDEDIVDVEEEVEMIVVNLGHVSYDDQLMKVNKGHKINDESKLFTV